MQILMYQREDQIMSSAKFTLIGVYQYFHNAGDDLFKNLDLPTGIDKSILESNILYQGGEFEVADANPFFIQDMIQRWSGIHYNTIKRWIDALAITYNPLENYDRMEHWTDERDLAGSSSSNGSSNSSSSVSQTGTLDETDTNHTETKKSSFDSSSYSPYQDENTTSTREQDTTNSTTITDGTTVEDAVTTSSSDDSEHNGRVHGNIGVTTSQQMLTQELDMGYWNIYQRVTELFLREFCIPIYD